MTHPTNFKLIKQDMTNCLQHWTKEDYDHAEKLIIQCRKEIRRWEIEQIKDFETFCKMQNSGGFSKFDFYGEDELECDEYSLYLKTNKIT